MFIFIGWQFFKIFVYGDVDYAQTGGIDPEKLYRATVKCQFKQKLPQYVCKDFPSFNRRGNG